MDISTVAMANALILGISIASIFLVAAIGLTIIYGTAGVINMAHGEFIMLGAYATYAMQTYFGLPYFLCIPCGFVIVGAIGFVIEKLLIQYLYHRPLDTLLATWGVSLVLIQGTRLIFGSDPKYIQMPGFLSSNIELGGVSLAAFRIFVILAALALIALVWFVFYKTDFGIKVRAVTQNREMAAAFGINSKQVYSFTFAFGAGLAGVAGALFGVLNIVLPTMGTGYVVQAFLIVVTGGGALMGSAIASIATGEMQSIFAMILNDSFARFLIFILIVVFLRFRPQGLISAGGSRR
ncbi:MAG: urea ABC transporter permease subunit UrtB [Rhodobacteraceae bacterium]|nr:urea ABC transporter permease subunit UrtB [Paracoccaceae bacterium]